MGPAKVGSTGEGVPVVDAEGGEAGAMRRISWRRL